MLVVEPRKRPAVTVTSETTSHPKIISFAQKCADAGLKYGSTQVQWKPYESKEINGNRVCAGGAGGMAVIEILDNHDVREPEVIDLLDCDDEEEATSTPVLKRTKKTVD